MDRFYARVQEWFIKLGRLRESSAAEPEFLFLSSGVLQDLN